MAIPAAVLAAGERERQQQAAAAPTPASEPAPVEADAEPEGLLQRSGRRAVQEFASAPATFHGLYGLAGAAYDRFVNDDPWSEAVLSDAGKAIARAANNGVPGAREVYEANPEGMLRPGLDAAAEWYEWGGEIAGATNNPDGSVPLDEEVGGIALSTLLTLPLLPAKAISLGSKAATMTARGALRTAEMATPITLVRSGASATEKGAMMGANLGVGVAINDASRALLQEPTLLGQLVPGGGDAAYGSVTPPTGVPTEYDAPESSEVAGTALAAGGLAGLGMALRPGRVGRGAEAAATGIRRARNSWLDDSGNLVEDVRRARGDAAAEQFDDLLRAGSRMTNEVSNDRFMNMGVLAADGSVKTTPGRVVNESYDSLSSRQRELFDMGQTARSEVADRGRPTPIKHSDMTDTELDIRVQAARNDPQVRAVMDMYDDSMSGFRKWRLKSGMIDFDQFTRENARGVYVPQMERRTLGQRAKEAFLPRASRGSNNVDVPSVEQRREGGVLNPMKPMEAFNAYTSRQIGAINEMSVRRSYLKQVANAPASAFPDGRRSVVRIKDAAHRRSLRGKIVTIRDEGREVEYMVADPRTARQLEFRPHASMPYMDVMRRVFQKATTGNLNPLFAPTSLAYDATFGMLAADNNKVVTGFLDQGLKQAGASVGMRQALAGATRAPDTLMLIAEGIARGAHGRYRKMLAERAAAHAARAGTRVSQQAAEEAAQIFMQSKFGLMHMSGYSANSIANNMEALDASALVRMTRRAGAGGVATAAEQTARAWSSALDTIRDAYRMGMFARNVSAAKISTGATDLSRQTYNRITRHVREVASDPSRRGESDFFNATLSTVPYGGVMVHSAAHLFAQAKNPAAYSTLMTVAAMKWYYETAMTPEAREYIETREPEYRRIGNMYIERDREEGEAFDPAKHIERIPLGPELGTMSAMAATLFRGALQEMSGQPDTSLEAPMVRQMLTATGDLFSFATPPALNFAAASFGKGQIQPGAALDGREFFRPPMIDGGIEEQRGIGQNSGIIGDRIHGMLTAALGAAGRTIGDAAEVMDSNVEKYDGTYWEAADDAMDVAWQSHVTEQAQRYTLFPQEGALQSRSTSSGNRAYNIDTALERITEMERHLMPTITGTMDADIPFSDLITEMPKKIPQGPLREQAVRVSEYFASPYHKPLMDEIGQLRKSYRRMQGNTDVPRAVRNEALNDVNEMMQERYDIVLENYGSFEQSMKERTGNPDWTLDNYARDVEGVLMNR